MNRIFGTALVNSQSLVEGQELVYRSWWSCSNYITVL